MNHSYSFKKILSAVLIAFVLAAVVMCSFGISLTRADSADTEDQSEVYTARPSVNGRLHVQGSVLADESGREVQLRGVSTHGLTWYPEYIDEGLFEQVAQDWNCNMVRLAMYSQFYSEGQRDENLALMRQGIDAAIAADMYVLVDWHILNDYDPNINIDSAVEFFETITSEYSDCPNLIFEICNEPNGTTAWYDVTKYCNVVIPVIRNNIPDAVIVVGTPEYDRNLGDPYMSPLEFDNVMYVLHFYTATHHDELMGELQTAIDNGLPVFISECGITEADGDGTIDFEWAATWFTFLRENNISYAVWSLSNKDESSAFFNMDYQAPAAILDEDLSTSGRWVRELIRGADPASIPAPAARVEKTFIDETLSDIHSSLWPIGTVTIKSWPVFALISVGVIAVAMIVGACYNHRRRRKRRTYKDIVGPDPERKGKLLATFVPRALLLLSIFCTINYLCWRVMFSIPKEYGVIPIIANVILLIVEAVGFIESLVLFRNLLGMREYKLPSIPDDMWPEVDVFIATYNEPEELLCRTINGCKHMKYPDRSKVHIWVCDDNRRAGMRALASKMGVGYFDRPDNEGAKAGNLNNALSKTSAPYVVTLDADMIPKSDFLLKTIPYFVDAAIREQDKPEGERLKLGLLQTPQCFYDPDVFQYALYSEKRAPNEQDFFYRTIEPSKTSTNSVIYGGSNTVIAREALNDIGGFFTGSITEDFATGLLIESKGYVSLALPEPLASGQTPHEFKDHIKQRTRWARGVIVTARKLKIMTRRDITTAQRVNYWSSIIYWYSPIKNLIYVLSPLLYAVLAVPVFKCNWLELLVFWLPMFTFQEIALRVNSKNTISLKWSGIYETSVMPFLIIPVIKESLGITMSSFKVTDKSRRSGERTKDTKAMIPFIVMALLSVAGIVRILVTFDVMQSVSVLILLFWIVRNLYYFIMCLFLVDGRDSDEEPVKVRFTETVSVSTGDGTYGGVTTKLTERQIKVYLDDAEGLRTGTPCDVTISRGGQDVTVKCAVTGVLVSRKSTARIHTLEIMDYNDSEEEYWQVLYDRIPTLPQSLNRDFGILSNLWHNIAHRIAGTVNIGEK